MLPAATERQVPRRLEDAREARPLEPSEATLRILAPRTVRECIFSCLKPSSWWKFVTAGSGLVLPRAADQGSVRAGWQLLGGSGGWEGQVAN